MSKKTTTLEAALSRHINATNTDIVRDRATFDELANKFLSKSSAVLGLKDYLKSLQSSPRVLGLLVYSSHGNRLLRDWVDQGMNTKLLYRGIMYDGAFWQRAGAELPIAEDIIHGDQKWDFDPAEYFSEIELLTSLPGSVEAMIGRFRASGELGLLLKSMPLFTLRKLLLDKPDLFKDEVRGLPYDKQSAGEDWASLAAIDVLKKHLNEENTFKKMLGMKVA